MVPNRRCTALEQSASACHHRDMMPCCGTHQQQQPCGCLCCSHCVQVVGNRYNEHTGILTLSCDRHRAREENRRQAMHWMLNLIESALVAHPSEDWETLKEVQKEEMQILEQDAVPEYLQYITPTIPTPTVSTQLP